MIRNFSAFKKVKKSLLFITFFCLSLYVKAQPGSLDPSFGESGKVITTIPDSYPEMMASAMQGDGKIIFAGSNSSIEGDGVLILRYLADGRIDSSFGQNGQVFSDFGPDYESATCVAIAADNSIIVGGFVSKGFVNPTHDILLAKYKPNGTSDSSFGTNGKLTKSFGYDEKIYSISLQEDGKIILGGTTSQEFLITRFNSNGQVDPSFGNNGYTTTAFAGLAVGKSTTIQTDGKILLAGFFPESKFTLTRYLTNGQLDPSFGNSGKVITDIPNGTEIINSIALQTDGKIIAGGLSGGTLDALNENMTLVRYNTDGTKDVTFGQDGIAITSFEGVNSEITKVLIRPDNKITALGRTFQKDLLGSLDFALAAYTENGLLDPSFGTNGEVVTDFGNAERNTWGFLQPDGKIVLSGMSITSEESLYQPVLARYFDRQQERYVHIKRWLHRHGVSWDDCPKSICGSLKYYIVERSYNGKIFSEIARIYQRNNSGQIDFEDGTVTETTAYYRIGAVNIDNSISYSNVLSIQNTATAIKLFPNPASSNLNIQGLAATQKSVITVSDLNGVARLQKTVYASTYTLNITNLPKGNYLVHVKTENSVENRNFVKE